MRLLVFLHGTVLMHRGALGRSREERVAQVSAGADPSVHDYGAYVPVGDPIAKLRRWQQQGAQIAYLSSHRNPDDIAADERVLRKHGFPSARLLARRSGQSYGDLAARERPDVLIEDDCESIGPDQITYPQIRADLRSRIKSIVVPEFGGIDHLPDDLQDLLDV
jgi:hypothetical protein